jgi:peptide chain release factor subunit 1
VGPLAEIVRSLAAARSEDGACVSLYLDLGPATVPTARDVEGHAAALLDEAARRGDEWSKHAGHAEAMQLRNDLGDIRRFLEDDLDRAGIHGLALFVSGPLQAWREVRLPGAIQDAVYVGSSFVVAQLLQYVERDRDVVLAVVGRDRGTIWRADGGGRIEEVDDLSRHGQGWHDQGGWSQARYQRTIEFEAREHMRDVAEAIADLVREGSDTLLVVSCLEERRAEFEELLEPHVRKALIGWADYDARADGDDLRPEVERLLDEHLRREREGLLERWREEHGQASGRASDGWAETLEAAADAGVDVLLVDSSTRDAYECPSCGRGYLEPGSCVLDSSTLREVPGGALELAIRLTLEHGGRVRWAPGEVEGGAVALLRFPLPVTAVGDRRR